MSKDETGNAEGQGLPGYSANNSIPGGGFALPIPAPTAAGQVEESPSSADPWSAPRSAAPPTKRSAASPAPPGSKRSASVAATAASPAAAASRS